MRARLVEPREVDAVDAAGALELGQPREERVPPMELAVALRMLVFASTHPMINDGNPLTAEQIVGILLDGFSIREDRPC